MLRTAETLLNLAARGGMLRTAETLLNFAASRRHVEDSRDVADIAARGGIEDCRDVAELLPHEAASGLRIT